MKRALVLWLALAACQKQSRHGGAGETGGGASGELAEALPIAANPALALNLGITRLDATHFLINPNQVLTIFDQLEPSGLVAPPPLAVGVARGDFVEAVNGQAAATVDKLALAELQPGQSFTLTVRHAGSPVTVEYRMRARLDDTDYAAGVGQLDDRHFQITTRFLARLLIDPGLAYRDARIVPSRKDGLANGFKLYAVRPGNSWASLGIQNGDTLESINSSVFSDGASVERALPSLLRARHFSVGLSRRLQPVTLTWDVVEALSPAAVAGRKLALSNPRVAPGLPLPPTPRVPLAPPPSDSALDAGIKLDPATGVVTIQRALINQLLGEPSVIATSVRIIPAVKNGKPFGIKLYAIRPGSVPARLQFQNGDTITAINGGDISTPDAALTAYTKLKTATSLTLSLERRGLPATLEWRIVPDQGQ